jgi:hypothetical protein
MGEIKGKRDKARIGKTARTPRALLAWTPRRRLKNKDCSYSYLRIGVVFLRASAEKERPRINPSAAYPGSTTIK